MLDPIHIITRQLHIAPSGDPILCFFCVPQKKQQQRKMEVPAYEQMQPFIVWMGLILFDKLFAAVIDWIINRKKTDSAYALIY